MDSSPDGRVRRQSLALINRNKQLLHCLTHLALAIVELALGHGGCENESSAQNAIVFLMSYSANNSAPGLKSRLEAFVKNTSHRPCLNALTLHVLNSRPVLFFCDFFHAICQLGHAAPPSSLADIAPALRRAMTIAKTNTVIQQAALCYFELIGTDACIAFVADTLHSANCSCESYAAAVALASLDCDERLLSKFKSDSSSTQPVNTFSINTISFLNALPTFFHTLPSASLRALSLQIVHLRADLCIAPFVLKCLFSLPHFLLRGFVFKTWLLVLQRMQSSAALCPTPDSLSVFTVCFGDVAESTSVIDFSHRTGIAAMFLPLHLQLDSDTASFIFEFASNFSDFSDDGLFALQQVLSHLTERCVAMSYFPALARILVNLCVSNINVIEEIIEVIKNCHSIWAHVLQHLEHRQKQGSEFHPACRRLAVVLLSCMATKEAVSIKRGKFSPDVCSLFVSWSTLLESYDLIISLWLDAAASNCFIPSCDRSTCVSIFRLFFSSPSHADSLRSAAKKFKLVSGKVSESACCSCFTSCCIESLLHVMGARAEGQSECALASSIVDSAMTFLNVAILQLLPVFENKSHSPITLEFILRGVRSSESSLGDLSGQALTSLLRHPLADSVRSPIECAISASVSKLFVSYRQCEYTSAARTVAASLVSTCPQSSGFTASRLLHEVGLRVEHEIELDSKPVSCSDVFHTIRLQFGPPSFCSCGSLCLFRVMETWNEGCLDLIMDCVSVTLMNSHQHLSQDKCDILDSSGDEDSDLEFVGKSHVFEVRKRFRTIYEGLLLLSEFLKRCPVDSLKVSSEWLERVYVNVMGLCCNVDHVGATETAAAVLFHIFETPIVRLKSTARMLVLRTLSTSLVVLSLEDPNLIRYLESVDKGVALPERNAESYGWRRSSHVCLPIVSSLKALVSSHPLYLPDGTDLFDAFVSAVIFRAKRDPASNTGVDCLNLLYFITNERVLASRVYSRRSDMLSVCFAAFSSSSFNCQSAACLVTSNLVTKVYGMLLARKTEYEVRVSSLTPSDWMVFSSLSSDCAPGALIALFSVFSMLRATDDELLSLECIERCRNIVLACCNSPIAKLRFSASRALPRLVAPSVTMALISDLSMAKEDANRKRHWNRLHGLTLAITALQESLRTI